MKSRLGGDAGMKGEGKDENKAESRVIRWNWELFNTLYEEYELQ